MSSSDRDGAEQEVVGQKEVWPQQGLSPDLRASPRSDAVGTEASLSEGAGQHGAEQSG